MKKTKKYRKKYTLKKYKKRKTKTTKKKYGGMTKVFGNAVKTIGTEYTKDQAQKIFLGKPNVLKSINENSRENRLQNRSYLSYDKNNKENINPNIKMKNVVIPINIKNSSYDMEL